MNYSVYSIERMAHDINAQRINEAKSYRIWQKARNVVAKRAK